MLTLYVLLSTISLVFTIALGLVTLIDCCFICKRLTDFTNLKKLHNSKEVHNG